MDLWTTSTREREDRLLFTDNLSSFFAQLIQVPAEYEYRDGERIEVQSAGWFDAALLLDKHFVQTEVLRDELEYPCLVVAKKLKEEINIIEEAILREDIDSEYEDVHDYKRSLDVVLQRLRKYLDQLAECRKS